MSNRGSNPNDRSTPLTRAIERLTGALGSFTAIALSAALVALWLIGGLFVSGRFSNDTYQLVINTVTTVITFLMVFVIQNTQNRDNRAIQTKLDAQNEALHAIAGRLDLKSDIPLLLDLVGLEDAPEREIKSDQQQVRDEVDGHATAAR